MGEKETVLDWGVCLSQHLQVLAASFPERFPPNRVAKLKQDYFYGWLPKQLKAVVAYLKATPNKKTYSDYLPAAREAEKEEAMEPTHGQTMNSTSKPKLTSFFPLRKLRGTQPTMMPGVYLAHLEEVSTDNGEGTESEDPDGLDGVTGGIHSMPGPGCKGSSTGRKTLLPLW